MAKFQVGDNVRHTGFTSDGTIVVDMGGGFYQVDFNSKGNVYWTLHENDLTFALTSKFKLKDKVRIISKDPSYSLILNTEAEVTKTTPTGYYVTITEVPSPFFGHDFFVDDTDIELINNLKSGTIPYTPTVQQFTTGTGYWSPPAILGLEGGITFSDASNEYTLGNHPTKHKCSWKTYTGLMYKEEYCDCGKTMNRRGIYD